MKTDPLAALLAKCAQGDEDAYAVLYRHLEVPVYRFIQKKLNDPVESSDLFHIAMMEVWRSAGKFEGRSSVKTWVFAITYRKIMTHFRSRRDLVLSGEIPEIEDETPSAETCLISAQSASHVRHCVDSLKEDHRTAIGLVFYEDMGYREISEVLNVPEGTIKTRVFHAKKLLLRCLSIALKKVCK